MHDAPHIKMILNIAKSAWLIDFCLKARKSCSFQKKLFTKFYGRYQDLTEKYQISQENGV